MRDGHLDDGALQRLLDGELGTAEDRLARTHATACAACAARLEEARDELRRIDHLLSRLDVPAPPLAAGDVMEEEGTDAVPPARPGVVGTGSGGEPTERVTPASTGGGASARGGAPTGVGAPPPAAQTGPVAPAPPSAPPRAPRPSRTPSGASILRRAAAVILALAVAGAAWAAPGSPLPGWWDALTGGAEPAPGSARADARRVAGPGGGVALVPGDSLVIAFDPQPPGTEVRVEVDDGDRVRVRTVAGTATWAVEGARIVVRAASEAPVYRVQIPRTAPWIEVRSAQGRLLLKDGARLLGGDAGGASDTRVFRLGSRRSGGGAP